MSLDAWALKRIVSNLGEKYPSVPLLDACKRYRDKVVSMSKPVGNHEAYLEGHFEREAQDIAAQPKHAFGAGAPVFKASEQEAHAKGELDVEKLMRLMAQGVPDDEAVRRATVGDEERVGA